MKKIMMTLFLASVCFTTAYAGQSDQNRQPTYRVTMVPRTILAINYQNRTKTDIGFQGSPLMPLAKGDGDVESKNGRIAVKGWKAQVELTPDEAIPQLEPYTAAFLYTHVDTEGTMRGFPADVAARLRKLTKKQLIVAGGIRSQQEVDALDALGADAVVGMAVYTDLLTV